MKTALSRLTILIVSLLTAASSYAAEAVCTSDCHPLYFGIEGGYGSTTWSGLVPDEDNQNNAMSLSTPMNVTEGGAIWGLFAGVELLPYFAIEGNYTRYPKATLIFGTDSIFYFDDNQTYLVTYTDAASLMGKIMMVIPHTQVRAYSSFGAAVIHRWDTLNDTHRVSPTFGLGLNYNITKHVMAELAGSYTAGFGESELQPANDYMPFLYAIYLRLAYKI